MRYVPDRLLDWIRLLESNHGCPRGAQRGTACGEKGGERGEERDGQTRETRRDNEELYKTHESIVVMIPTRSHYVAFHLHLHLHSRARPVLRPERALCGRCLRSWYVLERRALALCPLLGLVRSFARLLVRSFARSLVRPHSLTRSPRSSAVIGIDLYALISTDVRPPLLTLSLALRASLVRQGHHVLVRWSLPQWQGGDPGVRVYLEPLAVARPDPHSYSHSHPHSHSHSHSHSRFPPSPGTTRVPASRHPTSLSGTATSASSATRPKTRPRRTRCAPSTR